MAIALGSSLPDVGTAASLVAAGHADAVVFTESPESLGEAAAALVAAQQPARVIIVGGTAAVGTSVEGELRRHAPNVSIERLAGTDRIHTAALAAIRVLDVLDDGRSLSVILANGWSLPDVGAAASAVAAGLADAVLYTALDSLSERTQQVLRRFDPADVLISGGPAAIAPATQAAAVKAADGATARRLGGATRTHTAALLAQDAYPTTSAGLDTLVVADGWSLADVGVAASLAAALGNAAVIYADGLSFDDTTARFVAVQRTQNVFFVSTQVALPAMDRNRLDQLFADSNLTSVASAAASSHLALGLNPPADPDHNSDDDDADRRPDSAEPPGQVTAVSVDWNEDVKTLKVEWRAPTSGGAVKGYAIDRTLAGESFPDVDNPSDADVADAYFRRWALSRIPLTWSGPDWGRLVDHGNGELSSTLRERLQCDEMTAFPPHCGLVGAGSLAYTAQLRVIAYNDAGFSLSAVLDVPTQVAREHRDMQAVVASWVQQYGPHVQWLQEVWRYIQQQQESPTKTNSYERKGFAFEQRGTAHWPGFAAAGVDSSKCTQDGLCALAVGHIGDQPPIDLKTTIHELGHVYTLSNEAPSNPLAVAVGFLYLNYQLMTNREWRPGTFDVFSHPCNPEELYASEAEGMVSRVHRGVDSSRVNTFSSKWSRCRVPGRESLWRDQSSTTISILNGQVPSWYAATFRDADGNWDLDALWAAVNSLTGHAWRFVAYALKDEFGGYCSGAREIWERWGIGDKKWGLGGNPWRDSGCVPYSGPRKVRSVTLAVGADASGQPECSTANCKHFAIELDASNGYYDVECWSSGSSTPFFLARWHWPFAPLWAEGGCWGDLQEDGSAWIVVDGIKSNEIS